MGAWRGPGRGQHTSQAGSGTRGRRGRGVRGGLGPRPVPARASRDGALEENARPGRASTSHLLTAE